MDQKATSRDHHLLPIIVVIGAIIDRSGVVHRRLLCPGGEDALHVVVVVHEGRRGGIAAPGNVLARVKPCSDIFYTALYRQTL